MTDLKKEDLELKKIEVEKLKWLEGIFRTLFLALIADIGGVAALLLKVLGILSISSFIFCRFNGFD